MTAIFAAGLSTRAVTRTAQPFNVTGLGAGICLPLSLGTAGITVRGHAAVEFFGADLTGARRSASRDRSPCISNSGAPTAGWSAGRAARRVAGPSLARIQHDGAARQRRRGRSGSRAARAARLLYPPRALGRARRRIGR